LLAGGWVAKRQNCGIGLDYGAAAKVKPDLRTILVESVSFGANMLETSARTPLIPGSLQH